jgi:hypothetical protein
MEGDTRHPIRSVLKPYARLEVSPRGKLVDQQARQKASAIGSARNKQIDRGVSVLENLRSR